MLLPALTKHCRKRVLRGLLLPPVSQSQFSIATFLAHRIPSHLVLSFHSPHHRRLRPHLRLLLLHVVQPIVQLVVRTLSLHELGMRALLNNVSEWPRFLADAGHDDDLTKYGRARYECKDMAIRWKV